MLQTTDYNHLYTHARDRYPRDTGETVDQYQQRLERYVTLWYRNDTRHEYRPLVEEVRYAN